MPANAVVAALPGDQSIIPIYPGAKQVDLDSSDPCNQQTTFTSDDSNNQISTFYKDALQKRGWESPSEMYGGLYFRKGGNELSLSFIGYSKKEVQISVGCLVGLPAQRLDSRTPTPPRINITRQQYEEALAKWKAAGVEEYEITVATFAFLGGVDTTRVSDNGNKLLLLLPSPTPAATPDPQYVEYDKEDTVEGMFSEIEQYLQGDTVIHSAATCCTNDFYMAYSVEFDPDLGYPVKLSGTPVTAPGDEVFDADWAKTVTEMKILKRNTSAPTSAAPSR